MSTMKIGTTGQTYANDDFSFQVNPKIINVPFSNNDTTFNIPYGLNHVFLGAGGVGIRRIILTGEVYGASKLTLLNNLAKEIYSNNVKRFWISATTYFNVKGKEIGHSYKGGRTNFIDYVAALDCVTPFALAGTASTYTVPITNAAKTTLNDATGSSTGNFTNGGNAPALVKWTIENAVGANITKIEIGDTSDFATSPHKIEWNGTLASGSTLIIDVFNYAAQGTRGTFKELRVAYSTIAGTATSPQARLLGEAMPWVNVGSSDQAFSIQLTGNNNTANVTATYNVSNIGRLNEHGKSRC